MQSDDPLTPVLIAAVLTLLATVLVQSVVVPWVQARTRRRERWEAAVTELSSLVEEQLPRAVAEFREAADTERFYRSIKDDPQYDTNKINEGLRVAAASRREAAEIVGQHRKRMKLLTTRITRAHRKSPFWLRFRKGMLVLDFETSNATFGIIGVSDGPSDDEWNKLWKKQAEAKKKFVESVDHLATSMRPPSRELHRRAWRQAKTRIRRLAGRTEPSGTGSRGPRAQADAESGNGKAIRGS